MTAKADIARDSATLADRLDQALCLRGVAAPLALARIDESACIGCTLCIDACPVDAIAGAAKRMHVVLPALCVGCELCLPACPVDCIAMVPAGREWSAADARAARERRAARDRRLARNAASSRPGPAAIVPPLTDGDGHDAARARRQAAVAAALQRARRRRAAAAGS